MAVESTKGTGHFEDKLLKAILGSNHIATTRHYLFFKQETVESRMLRNTSSLLNLVDTVSSLTPEPLTVAAKPRLHMAGQTTRANIIGPAFMP